MGRAALAARKPAAKNRRTMAELDDLSSELITSPERDVEGIDRTLADECARALNLGAERLRLERRLAEAAERLRPGDPDERTIELSELARRLNATAAELTDLRRSLVELRRLRLYTSPERTA